jgi:hypothetical protein
MQLPPGGQITHVDIDLMRLRLNLSPGQRILAMLDAQELVIAMKRGRLKEKQPELTDHEIGLLIIEEIEFAKRHEFKWQFLRDTAREYADQHQGRD